MSQKTMATASSILCRIPSIFFFLLLLVGPLLVSCQAQQESFVDPKAHATSLIHDILIRNDIIGDVLDDFEPSISLQISYPSEHEAVLLGNDIPVSSVSKPPVFEFHSFGGPHLSTLSPRVHRFRTQASENLTYTIALTDPDAKSRNNPIWSEMCHWVVTNLTLIPSTQTPKQLISYLPPSPPPKTGAHRYVFVLLAGSQEATAKLVAPDDSSEGRRHWGYEGERIGVAKWASEFGLEVVGANFFYARNEKQ